MATTESIWMCYVVSIQHSVRVDQNLASVPKLFFPPHAKILLVHETRFALELSLGLKGIPVEK